MNLSIYSDDKTWLHSLDPRTKLFGTTIVFIVCLCFNHPLHTGAIALCMFALVLSAGAQKAIWKLRYIILMLFLFSAMLWPFFTSGKTIVWTWKSLKLTRESILYGLAMVFRLSTFVITGLILMATTKNEEITDGLIKMKIPYPLAFAFSTALRLVPTFVKVGATIVQAQVSRGLDLESRNIISRFGKFIPLAVPMFISAIRYTNLLAMALESRGFSPDMQRTFFYEPTMTKRDWIILSFLAALLFISLYMRIILNMGVVMPGRI